MIFRIKSLSESLNHIDAERAETILNQHSKESGGNEKSAQLEEVLFHIFLIDPHTYSPIKMKNLALNGEFDFEIDLKQCLGIFLFLGQPKTVRSWPDKNVTESDRFKENLFYIQTFLSYGIARYVHSPAPRHKESLSDNLIPRELEARLKRIASRALTLTQSIGNILEQVRSDSY